MERGIFVQRSMNPCFIIIGGMLAKDGRLAAWVVEQSGPLDQERVSDLASAMGRGDEIKLDPNTLSLINAACTEIC
jgi:hypothetical protein